MQNRYKERLEIIYRWLHSNKIDAAIIEDTEGRRDASLRYFCGLHSDALLFLFPAGRSILVPWDINLAQESAYADKILPYADFGRTLSQAVLNILKSEKIKNNGCIELPAAIPYPVYKNIQSILPHLNILCRYDGMNLQIEKQRIVKDKTEIDSIRTAAEITNNILDEIPQNLESGILQTELDISMFIEKEARKQGAEGTGFETLAAGQGRSCIIHPFPSFTNADFNKKGLGIIDFGIKVNGYSSDVTLGIVHGKPDKKQQHIINLVKEAYDLAFSQLKPGAASNDIAGSIEKFFSRYNCSMPHSLGHGIGLDVHEPPFIRNKKENSYTLLPGMVLTLEPGLYDRQIGGIRVENDFLITENGAEALTMSRILYLP